jgi:hypothetical protein
MPFTPGEDLHHTLRAGRQLYRHELDLQQHAGGVVHRVEVAVAHHGQIHIRQQAGGSARLQIMADVVPIMVNRPPKIVIQVRHLQ